MYTVKHKNKYGNRIIRYTLKKGYKGTERKNERKQHPPLHKYIHTVPYFHADCNAFR
jgi:hypothetical protein